MSSNNSKIDVDQLQYYFDAKRKDTKDKHSACDRSRRVLDLRDRLLTLSDVEFDLALKTLNGLLDQSKSSVKDAKSSSQKSREALNLYETAQAQDSSPPGKINPV